MSSLDDIWDTPAQSVSVPSNHVPIPVDDDDHILANQPTRRPRSTLFLDSGSEDEAPSTSKTHYASKPGSSKPDIDAFWDDLDEPDTAFQGLAPSLDVEALKRQADSNLPPLTPHQILPSSSPPRDSGNGKDGTKDKADGRKGDKSTTKKKRPILDEGRLLGPEGFPVLVKQAKEFKPKGKGHEMSDLKRLFTVYQFWSHQMYPNTQFVDTVQRVEKLCHTKRMHVALGVWRDEAKGLINGHKIGPNGSDNSDSDSDDDHDKAPATDVPIATEDERSSPASSRGPSLPPSSASEVGGFDDDFDIDAMIAEDEAAHAQTSSTSTSTSTSTGPGLHAAVQSKTPADEDEEMWDTVMADFPNEPYAPPERQPNGSKPTLPAGTADEDEEMWDIVREMEAEVAAKTTAPGEPAPDGTSSAVQPLAEGAAGLSGVDPTRKATNDEGWDEMYA